MEQPTTTSVVEPDDPQRKAVGDESAVGRERNDFLVEAYKFAERGLSFTAKKIGKAARLPRIKAEDAARHFHKLGYLFLQNGEWSLNPDGERAALDVIGLRQGKPASPPKMGWSARVKDWTARAKDWFKNAPETWWFKWLNHKAVGYSVSVLATIAFAALMGGAGFVNHPRLSSTPQTAPAKTKTVPELIAEGRVGVGMTDPQIRQATSNWKKKRKGEIDFTYSKSNPKVLYINHSPKKDDKYAIAKTVYFDDHGKAEKIESKPGYNDF